MPAVQKLLFSDPRPLVERLGRDFFRNLPERPGVYLMRGESEVVLYVGKAKNLRQRLRSYRVANPERMPRRHLRLLRSVARIELQECEDEQAALARESELLRTLKPRFNRAGTWPGKPRYFAVQTSGSCFALAVTDEMKEGWNCFGPMGTGAHVLRALLARLVWIGTRPKPGLAEMPAGWFHGRLDAVVCIECGSVAEQLKDHLSRLLSGEAEPFCGWLQTCLPDDLCAFERAAVAADLELLAEWFPTKVADAGLCADPGDP